MLIGFPLREKGCGDWAMSSGVDVGYSPSESFDQIISQ